MILPPAKQLKRAVKERVTKGRYLHSEGVQDTAVLLAGKYGCDTKKAGTAAILHDVARDLPLQTMQRIALMGCMVKTNQEAEMTPGLFTAQRVIGKNHATTMNDTEAVFQNRGLLHAYAGRVIACRDFGISDEEVLHSIELHTTGDAGMSILDKVVFVADYIEPNRSFRGVQTARKIAKRNLDETVLYIFSAMLRTLAQRKTFICSNTLLGYNELIRYRVGCTF